MNSILVNCLLACCIVICGNITNAAEDCIDDLCLCLKKTNDSINDNNEQNIEKKMSNEYNSDESNNIYSILNEDEKKVFSDCCIKLVLNNNPKVEYNPDEMWFDYQALFDKTKLAILGIDNDIEVKHTDFSQNDIARTALFGNSEYKDKLSEMLSGNIDAQSDAAYYVFNSYQDERDVWLANDMIVNYKYLISVVASLSNDYYATTNYVKYTGTSSFKNNKYNLFAIDYYNVVNKIM